MTDVLVPSSDIPVSGDDLPTVPYYQFFEDVSHAFTLVADEGNLKELDVRVTALENEDTEQTPIEGQMSIAVAPPNLISGAYTVSLKHDSQYPGNTTFYGTSATGDKGWHPIADTMLGTEGRIAKTVDSDGVVTFDLADVTVAAGGALKKYGFDAKGRLSESDDATTDDLSEGSANLYFTGDRARAAAVDNAITPGVTNKAPSEDAVSKALANVPTGVPYYVPAGDTFTVPLDKQALFSDPITLDGDLVVDGRLIDVAATAISGVSHTDTSTIAIAGDGTPTSPLSATAKISVVAGNKIIAKSDGLFTDSGGIHIDDRVANYADLPSPPPAGYTTYLVDADDLIYIWDGSAWPAEGSGLALSGEPGTIPDPYTSNVVALLHLDQPVTDTTVVDSAGITTWAAQGSAYFSPSKSRWGKTSCYISRGLKSAANAALVLGTDDFTIEMWINPYSLGGSSQYGRFFQIGPDTQNGAVSGGLYLYRSGSQDPCQVNLQGCSGSGYFNLIDAVDYATGTYVSSFHWHHVALCRQAGEFLLFINGLLVARNTPATYDITYNYFVLGGNSVGGEFLMGYYNEVRITKGVARYVDDFDPPNGPFANPT